MVDFYLELLRARFLTSRFSPANSDEKINRVIPRHRISNWIPFGLHALLSF
jgi:hypothetical protein